MLYPEKKRGKFGSESFVKREILLLKKIIRKWRKKPFK